MSGIVTKSLSREKIRQLLMAIGSESKAYPLKILNWHEAVNDTLGGEPIVVTF